MSSRINGQQFIRFDACISNHKDHVNKLRFDSLLFRKHDDSHQRSMAPLVDLGFGTRAGAFVTSDLTVAITDSF